MDLQNHNAKDETLAQQWLHIQNFIRVHKLPQAFSSTAWQYFLPLSENLKLWTKQKRSQQNRSFILGLNGAQGTGKSTLAELLSTLLRHSGFTVLNLSIDDLYLSKSAREDLSQTIHPLLKTRGVPGTHDTALACELLDELSSPLSERNKSKLSVPRFDKAIDDRSPIREAIPESQVDVIIFEGWCVGAKPQRDLVLDNPYNQLELKEDRDGQWRQYVNEQLANEYQQLFSKIDYLVMLKAPSFDAVFQWRSEQEERLRQSNIHLSEKSAIMDESQLLYFIRHYERLTRWMLKEMPQRVDCLFELNEDHCVIDKTCNTSNWKSTIEACRLLVITDLDASLLDENYSWAPAYGSLDQLNKKGFPVIFNSSKTLAEMIPLSKELHRQLESEPTPIVAENGGLIAYPIDGKYVISVSSLEYEAIIDLAHELRRRFDYQFIGFYDMSAEQISELTGLDLEAANQAKDRHATEPILWQDTDQRFDDFKKSLENSAIRVVRGGQFIHLMGQADKADALLRLKSFYQNKYPEHKWLTVALGDSPNDEAMLNAADFAVLIPNKNKNLFELKAPHSLLPSSAGPHGWQEAIQYILRSLYGIHFHD